LGLTLGWVVYSGYFLLITEETLLM